MNQAFLQFLTNIEEVRKTHLISTSINVPTSSIVDTSPILRSCIVLSVSAIDHLIHELAIIGMCEIFNGTKVDDGKGSDSPAAPPGTYAEGKIGLAVFPTDGRRTAGRKYEQA